MFSYLIQRPFSEAHKGVHSLILFSSNKVNICYIIFVSKDIVDRNLLNWNSEIKRGYY